VLSILKDITPGFLDDVWGIEKPKTRHQNDPKPAEKKIMRELGRVNQPWAVQQKLKMHTV